MRGSEAVAEAAAAAAVEVGMGVPVGESCGESCWGGEGLRPVDSSMTDSGVFSRLSVEYIHRLNMVGFSFCIGLGR